MESDLVLCLDSGTTSVKAAIYDRHGKMLARSEVENSALERSGDRVEQDMARSVADAERAIRACTGQVAAKPSVLALTAQGDGLWPIGADMLPAGKALTWLDGRVRPMLAAMEAELDAIEAITSARPTAASQTVQLLWLQQNEPERFATIRYALRLKEWLFLAMTGVLRAEPSGLLPAWGDWRIGQPSGEITEILGLEKGIEVLPEIGAGADCVAGLSSDAAARLGLPEGMPVVLGPGDVQSSLIGLGVGPGLSRSRGSIFGTSAIHGGYFESIDDVSEKLSGAMVQLSATGQGFVCFHPSFNGGTTFRHVGDLLKGELPENYGPAYSSLVLHPFFEPGGERAPITHPHASAALFGMSSATRSDELGWAAREALAFLTRMSHADLGLDEGQVVAVGGGVARDDVFMQLLASVLERPVRPQKGGDTALRGLAAVAMGILEAGGAKVRVVDVYLSPADGEVAPEEGAVREYLGLKFELFERLLKDNARHWGALDEVGEAARKLRGS
ncbi:FGGY family carbohydrate kinase [Sulfitobacter sp. PR48]|uniref:FGGY family carbohydrate kinase n=1 Tax=Sulfitobacter sp. PR48 TaxID=3028383 RepID=UPI00237B86F9|nr:FGGY family carbohydrate kinase [Sulfitobacter sp. PR48]MDD9721896.1 FGGY family carbohydrate kinase [Sulfitobacter sp. PR48]